MTTSSASVTRAPVRPDIAAIDGYVPGEQPQGGKWIKLNTNENPYAPSPAVARAIAAECHRGRPGVTVVCPGFFRSGLLGSWHFSSEVERREAGRRMGTTRWSSEAVAGRVLRAIERDERYVVVGRRARWLWRLKRLTPRSTTALLHRVYHRLR